MVLDLATKLDENVGAKALVLVTATAAARVQAVHFMERQQEAARERGREEVVGKESEREENVTRKKEPKRRKLDKFSPRPRGSNAQERYGIRSMCLLRVRRCLFVTNDDGFEAPSRLTRALF